MKFVEGQNVTLNYSERIAPAKGLSFGGKITLLSGMQPAEEFSTLVHEIAHEMVHRGDRRTLTTKQVRETEAEAVAFVVCQSVGLQTGSASSDYIQLWHGDAKLLQESLEVVQRTAGVILGGIAPRGGHPLFDLRFCCVGDVRSTVHPVSCFFTFLVLVAFATLSQKFLR